MNDGVLKKAFIDAQRDIRIIEPHSFSPDFCKKTEFLIKSQKGVLRAVNTVGKRVALIAILSVVISGGTVFGVDAIREPFIETVQNIFVNVKERLTGTRAGNISDAFSSEVQKIKVTGFVSGTEKVTYISDTEKITEFTKLLTTTDWRITEYDYSDYAEFCDWKFEFVGSDGAETVLRMCGITPENRGVVQIICDDKSQIYVISSEAYKNLITFTNTRYYLHKSNNFKPDKADALELKKEFLYALSEEDAIAVQDLADLAHRNMETVLIANVYALKFTDAEQWQAAINGGTEQSICFNTVKEELLSLAELIKNGTAKNAVLQIVTDIEKACDNHDISALFKAHEFIHDMDYFAVNYPKYCKTPPADWAGTEVYFGAVENIFK